MLPRRSYRRKHMSRSDAKCIGGHGKAKGVTSDEALRRPLKTRKQQRRHQHQELRKEYL